MKAPFEHEFEEGLDSLEQRMKNDVVEALGTLEAAISFMEKSGSKAPALKRHFARLRLAREKLRQWAEKAGEPCINASLRMQRLNALSEIFEEMRVD